MEDEIEGSGPPDTYHAAFQRLDSMNSSLVEEAPATGAGEALHARRRQSLRMMAAMSLNQSCKDAIQDVLLPSSDPLDNEADPTSKFRELLIEAKESGLTWEGIFSNFTPKPETTAAISQKDFAAGLQKLSLDTSCTMTPAEVDLLMKNFATAKGQQVSLDEIKAFALEIPHVSWKVERIRRLSSALSTEDGSGISSSTSGQATKPQIKKKASTTVLAPPVVAFKTTSARSFSRRDSSIVAGKVAFSSSIPAMRTSRSRVSSTASVSDSASGASKPPLPRKSSSSIIPEAAPLRPNGKPSVTPSPSLVEEPAFTPLVSLGLLATTSKLMWRQQENLLIELHGHDSLPRIISVVAHNEATQEDYPPIYVNREHIPLNRKAIEALAETKAASLGNEEDGTAGDPAGLTSLQQAEREYLAQYLVQRLVLEEGPEDASASSGQKHINILPQTGDTWDTLLTERPKLLQPPVPIPGARLVSLHDFHKASAEIARLTTQTRRHSMAAELYATMTTTELDDLAAAADGKSTGEQGAET